MLSNKPWNIAAGVLIAREAGAIIVDIDGSPHSENSRATIATCPKLVADLIAEAAKTTEAKPAHCRRVLAGIRRRRGALPHPQPARRPGVRPGAGPGHRAGHRAALLAVPTERSERGCRAASWYLPRQSAP
ncbi:inositol monophosphatase family protein [Nonomuraea longicatena]|uniref:Inositol-phosphate phosphatase n=1 Tax=Nonomuraea longicatena TaxID=83682 RepID=A0ABN1R7G3_9ACTN